MSTLQVANIHLESTGNNRIQYTGSNNATLNIGNTLTFSIGGNSLATLNSTAMSVNGSVSTTSQIAFGANQYTITSDLVLTAASPSIFSVETSNTNADIQLPAATSFSAPGARYKIYNKGKTLLYIKNNGGKYIKGIYPTENTEISLLSNATANGVWSADGDILEYTISKLLDENLSVGAPSSVSVAPISGTSLVVAFHNTDLGTYLAVATLTGSNWSLSTPQLITATSGGAAANISDLKVVLTSSSAGIVAAGDNDTTNDKTWVLAFTLSGTTFTTGASWTSATGTAAGVNTIYHFFSNGANPILVTNRSGGVHLRCITQSGTTITMGTQLSATDTNHNGMIQLSSTKWLRAYRTAADKLGLRYYTLSGTTISEGTEVATTANDVGYYSDSLVPILTGANEVTFYNTGKGTNSSTLQDVVFVVDISNASTPSLTSTKTRGISPISEENIVAFDTTMGLSSGSTTRSSKKIVFESGNGLFKSVSIPTMINASNPELVFVNSSVIIVFGGGNKDTSSLQVQAIYSS